MSKNEITKLVITSLILPVLFFLFAYFDEGLALSFSNFLSLLVLAAIGSVIGGVYAHFTHGLVFTNSFLTGFVPSVILMFIAVKVGVDDFVVLGDLCLIISCWFTASELAVIKNKSIAQ